MGGGAGLRMVINNQQQCTHRSVPKPPPLLARFNRALCDMESERSGAFDEWLVFSASSTSLELDIVVHFSFFFFLSFSPDRNVERRKADVWKQVVQLHSTHLYTV